MPKVLLSLPLEAMGFIGSDSTTRRTHYGKLLSDEIRRLELEDTVLKADDGIHLNWPPYFVQTGWWAEPGDIKKTEEYDMQCQEMEVTL